MASVKGTLADRIMHQATMRMTHDGPGGLNQDDLSIGELMERYDRGERLYIRCGTQARVAQVLLARAGIASRLVAILIPTSPYDRGHTFMEVRIKHHWIAYDPDGNRMPVDGQGNPMGAVREHDLVRSRHIHWRYIASDLYSDAYPDSTYDELNRAIRRVMGVLSIAVDPVSQEFIYRGTKQARYEVGVSPFGWTPAGPKQWARITKGEA
jgi:hypothetical protein